MATLKTVFRIKPRLLSIQRFPAIPQGSAACLSAICLPKYSHTCSNFQVFQTVLHRHQDNNVVNKKQGNSIIKYNYSTGSEYVGDDKGGIQVYEGRVKSLLKRVKIFSLSTSFIGLIGQPYLWYTVQDMSLFLAAPLFTAVNFFVFANPLMIHYLAKRYVTELYYNPATETYTATVLSFFARKQSFTFMAKDVVIPEIPGLFSMLTAKGRPIFIDHRDFTSIEVYKKMMGFDKPLDLTYNAESNKEQ